MSRAVRVGSAGALALVVAAVVVAGTTAASNRPPKWPRQAVVVTNNNQYAVVNGQPAISASTLKIRLTKRAVDPDGDRLRYSWKASNGRVAGNGLRGTWVRVVPTPGVVKPGTVWVTALDGRGGKAVYTLRFT